MKWLRCLPGRLAPLLTLCVLCAVAGESLADNWAHWRGPEQTGVSRDRDLPSKFSTDPKDPESNLVWKAPYGGRSTPIVMNGRVYLNNQAGEGVHEQERVLCLDADTGKKLWEKRFNVFHTDIVSLRLGWTNLAGDPKTGNVYWHGTQGNFVCFDKDGKILWQRQLTEQDGRISGYGGRLTSPVVAGELVILGMLNSSWGDQGFGGNRFVAMNKRNGEIVWWSNPAGKPRDTYASSPVVVVIGGQKLVISGGGDGGIHAMNFYTGQPVWSYPFSAGGVNASPVVEGNLVYVCNWTENPDNNVQGRVACLDAGNVADGKPKMLWKVDGIKVRYTSPVIHEGRLYVCDDLAHLHCLDGKTGKSLWRRPFTYGRNAKSAPVWADGKIYVGDVNGKFHILEPGAKSCKRLYEHFFESPDGTSDVEVSGNPAVANGRVYFLTQYEIYCIGKKNHTAKPDPIPPGPKEPPVGEPARVQVVPADVTLQPGDTAQLWVYVLDKNGRELPRAKVDGTWSLPVPPLPAKSKSKVPPPALKGSVEKILAKTTDGKGAVLGSWTGTALTVSRDVPAQQGYVVFDAGKLGKATARVRVAPRLPYAQNFDKIPDGAVPDGWVDAQNKTFVTTLKDGNKVLRRNNAIASPLVARGNCYIGLPGMTDYTIEADVMGTAIQAGKERRMPDIGVGANRYTLALWGDTQRLRLTSWDAIPRIDQPIEYHWKPGVWYRLKLTVTVEGDKAVCRGKAWPRGEKEPTEWMVEVTDPTPNREGCPTLYGYVTGHLGNNPGNEVYHDNVRIYPNGKGQQK